LGDNGRIFVQREQHGPLEALRPGDDHLHFTTEWIGSDPSLVLLFDVPASGLDSSFNLLAARVGGPVAVEDDQRQIVCTGGAGTRRSPPLNACGEAVNSNGVGGRPGI
jgi:hypothetical protein